MTATEDMLKHESHELENPPSTEGPGCGATVSRVSAWRLRQPANASTDRAVPEWVRQLSHIRGKPNAFAESEQQMIKPETSFKCGNSGINQATTENDTTNPGGEKAIRREDHDLGSSDDHDRRGGKNGRSRVTYLFEAHGLLEAAPSRVGTEDLYKGLTRATFQDGRWENAMQHLRDNNISDATSVKELLRRGAQSFGLWNVSDMALQALVPHVFEGTNGMVEPGVPLSIAAWLANQGRREHETQVCQHTRTTDAGSWRAKRSVTITSEAVNEFKAARRHSCVPSVRARRSKSSLFVVVLCISACITIPWKPTAQSTLFGPGLVVARTTGVGSLLWTAMLFLTMARTMIKGLYRCFRGNARLTSHLDAHETIHVFCGKMAGSFGILHTLTHLLCTYRIFSQESVQKLNKVIHCALDVDRFLGWMEWPACPFERNVGYWELCTSLTSLTGYLLLGTVSLMMYTAMRKARCRNYELFAYVHNFGIVSWVVLLFIHGAQGWFGVGIPLVLPICSVPIGLFTVDRVLRSLRYWFYAGHNITSVVVRMGKMGNSEGALTYLQIKKPSHLWNFRAGMYAYLNMPDYAPFQWHPFTIVSARGDETVDFIVSSAGDWTNALTQSCLDCKRNCSKEFPKVAMDGPYAAPATTAVCSEVLIAIGAGVGITPFLALMSRIVGKLGQGDGTDHFEEAHFFWTTRSADEFLFGRRHFTQIVAEPRLRDKVFLHLHLTLHEPPNDAPAFVFREAVRRQSNIDREIFADAASDLTAKDVTRSGCQGPHFWVRKVRKHDVFWVSSLVDQAESGANTMLPIIFGRPDFTTEIQAVGKNSPDFDVDVYVCANGVLADSIKDICRVCNLRAKDDVARASPQRYNFRSENFS